MLLRCERIPLTAVAIARVAFRVGGPYDAMHTAVTQQGPRQGDSKCQIQRDGWVLTINLTCTSVCVVHSFFTNMNCNFKSCGVFTLASSKPLAHIFELKTIILMLLRVSSY